MSNSQKTISFLRMNQNKTQLKKRKEYEYLEEKAFSVLSLGLFFFFFSFSIHFWMNNIMIEVQFFVNYRGKKNDWKIEGNNLLSPEQFNKRKRHTKMNGELCMKRRGKAIRNLHKIGIRTITPRTQKKKINENKNTMHWHFVGVTVMLLFSFKLYNIRENCDVVWCCCCAPLWTVHVSTCTWSLFFKRGTK